MTETNNPNDEFLEELSQEMDYESRVGKIVEEVMADYEALESKPEKINMVESIKGFVERFEGTDEPKTAARVAAYKEVIEHLG